MSKYLFLGRLKDQSNESCCLYIENKNPRWECDHYFGRINLHGSCFCHSDFPDYDDLETVLSREEYKELIVYNGEIGKLGYGIKRILRGIKTDAICRRKSSIFLISSIQMRRKNSRAES